MSRSVVNNYLHEAIILVHGLDEIPSFLLREGLPAALLNNAHYINTNLLNSAIVTPNLKNPILTENYRTIFYFTFDKKNFEKLNIIVFGNIFQKIALKRNASMVLGHA